MTPESIIKVTFHRTYEIDLSTVCGKLRDENYEDVQMTKELIEQKAEEITQKWLSEEVEDSVDFLSSTIEILN